MTVQVPILITSKMRSDLRGRGYADGAIDAMTPAEAWAALGGIPQPGNPQPRALHHLARARAGASDCDLDLIRATWPDVPTNGGGGLPAAELTVWLGQRPELADLVARIDPEAPPPEPDAGRELYGWQVFTVADAYAPRPPIEYIVKGLFPLPSLSIVYGPPGCFKTMLLADLAACVAAGLPWLEPLPGKDEMTARATIKAPVLWLDFDNGLRTMHERIEATARARDLPPDTPLYYVSMPNPWLDAAAWDSVAELCQRTAALGARVIIIDNLRDVSGGVEENASEMGDVMSNLRRLSEETGAAVVVIHHQRKSNGAAGRSGDTLRGHSSIEAALDLALLIEREEHADTIQIQATKVRGADVLPFGARFTYDWKGDTTDLEKVRFYGLEIEDLASDAAIRRAILEEVEAQPEINKGELTKAVLDSLPDTPRARVWAQIDHLTADGKLRVKQGARNAKLYSVPTVRDLDLGNDG
ncbi:MAG: AAA family ATPase [Chloroflexi bacterium]|nr:AAA family ATPase [Chloroflexota bacterium]